MARVSPLQDDDADPKARELVASITAAYGRATNMKRTLARSQVALRALMSWYDLRTEVQVFLGERLTTLFAHAISVGTDCLICSTFFRRLLIDSSEDPDRLCLDERRPRLSRVRQAACGRSESRVRRALRPNGPVHGFRANRRADGVRQPDGGHQPLQQRASGRP